MRLDMNSLHLWAGASNSSKLFPRIFLSSVILCVCERLFGVFLLSQYDGTISRAWPRPDRKTLYFLSDKRVQRPIFAISRLVPSSGGCFSHCCCCLLLAEGGNNSKFPSPSLPSPVIANKEPSQCSKLDTLFLYSELKINYVRLSPRFVAQKPVIFTIKKKRTLVRKVSLTFV